MPTSKKSASKKASKKTSAKKSTKATAAKQKIEFALNPERVAAIKRCLDKGTLRVTISRADLLRGRVKDPWLYD